MPLKFKGIVTSAAGTGQCVGTNELEGLRYHLYSELAESQKEIETLRADLNYWQNETLNILKKYLIVKEGNKSNLNITSLYILYEHTR